MDDIPKRQTETARSKIVPDLTDIVEEWVQKVNRVPGYTVKPEDLEIQWDKVHFDTTSTTYTNKRFATDPDPQELFKTSFHNETSHIQHQDFETSVTSTSTATTTLASGFTRGKSGNIMLSVPESIRTESLSSFSGKLVINEDGEKTERTQNWKGKTSVDAMPFSKTVVQTSILQKILLCDFKMKVNIHGKIMARIHEEGQRKRYLEGNIVTILRDMKDTGMYAAILADPKIKTKHIEWPIAGQITFKYGVEIRTRCWNESL